MFKAKAKKQNKQKLENAVPSPSCNNKQDTFQFRKARKYASCYSEISVR